MPRDAVAVLAQIMPVLLLVLAVERRALGPIPKRRDPVGLWLGRLRAAVELIALVSAIAALTSAMAILIDQPPMGDWRYGLLSVAWVIAAVGTTGVLMELFTRSTIGEDARKAAEAEQERRAWIEYRARRVRRAARAGRSRPAEQP